MRWLGWPLYLPSWILLETIYLVRHPRTFRRRAVAVALPIGAFSYLLFFVGVNIELVYLTQVASVVVYYVIKFSEHRRARIDRIIKRITS